MSTSHPPVRHTTAARRRIRGVVALTVTLLLVLGPAALAAWVVGSLPGAAAARASTLPMVASVTATASGQSSASVAWQPAALPGGAGPATYQVTAYPEGGGAARTPGGTCASPVTSTSCEDASAPAGSWVYRVSTRLASWTGAASDPSAPVTLPAGADGIVAENQKPGSPASEWDVSGSGDSTLQGFATDISTDRDGTVRFKVDDTARAPFRIDIYRLGWYGGDGARKVTTIPSTETTATDQAGCLHDTGTGLRDCGNWTVSATWHVPADAVSGLYLGRLVRTDTGGASHVPFVVRDDTGHSAVLFQTSDTTWQAYNRYGGTSLYWGDGPGTGGGADGRAYKVSYNRPFNTRDATPEDYLFNGEYPMIRWLERNGYDVSYAAGVDTARSGAELLEHKTFLSVGHDEYWSGPQRANVEAALHAGVNLAFLSSDECFWRTRYENSTDGTSTPYRTLVGYKETHDYPNNPDPTSEWTGTWRDPRGTDSANEPENGLTGQIFMVNDGSSAMTVPAEDGQLRLWRNSSVASSPGADTFGDRVIGYEWDEDLDNGVRPYGQIRLSDTTVNGVEKVDPAYYGSVFVSGSTARHTVTLHRDRQSGALVFGSGTIQWSWGLDSSHDRGSGATVPAMQQATVNVLADMEAQPSTLQSGLTPADASTDTRAPTATLTSPTGGGTIQAGSTVTVTGTATDTGGGLVGGVEVSTDDGSTWHPAEGRASWSYPFTAPAEVGTTVTIRTRATDDSLNTETPGAGTTVTTTARECTSGTPCSIFPSAAPGTVHEASDQQPIELGVRFRSTENGAVTGVRFYKAGTASSTYTGRLYTSTGTLLGSTEPAAFDSPGWKELPLTGAVPTIAGTTYVASYYSSSGDFSITEPGSSGSLATATVNPPLRGLAAGEDGPNGVFHYGAGGGFPDAAPTSPGPNYWADLLFVSTPDTTPPTVTSGSPAAGATNVPVATEVTATFDEPVSPDTVTTSTFTLAPTGGGANVAATVSSSGPTATLVPTSPLSTDTTYVATLVGGPSGITDTSSNPLEQDHTWSFTTAASAEVTLFGDVTPGLSTDAADYELGVRFSSSTDGTVTGIRFYKGPENTGLHTGRLWDATTHQLLGTVTFTDETAAGWQTAYFDSPVAVQAGTSYIASYTVPVGYYGHQANYFTTSGHTSGPLTAPRSTTGAPNGVYSETPGQFPTSSFNDSNYFVGVSFQSGSDVSAPSVTGRSPAAGATGVATSAKVTATFSEPVKPATVTGTTFTLGNGGTAVPATVTTSGSTVMLTPAAPLENDAAYSVTLKGGSGGVTDLADNPLPNDVTWAFTTTPSTTTAYTIFGSGRGGTTQGPDQPGSIEPGVKFRVSQGGHVSAIRFYKPYTEGDFFTGRLYSASGSLLGEGSATLPANATGWQEIPLASPVALSPDTTYVATYLSPTGRYAYTAGGLVGAPVTNGPVTALQSGTDGPNGVYSYGGGFPTTASPTPANYWADVVFDTGPLPPDTTAPEVTSRTPSPGATDVSQGSAVTVGFAEAVAPASVTADTFTLSSGGSPVAAGRQVSGATATLTPSGELPPSTSYTVTLKGGSAGITDLAGNPLSGDVGWSFTTRAGAAPRPDPAQGPGGPVLAVKGTGDFGGYLPEILRGEGLNLFTVGSAGDLTAAGLSGYEMVVLGQTDLTQGQVDALTTWVQAGGDLVTLRPDPKLAGLLGLTGPTGTLSEGYLAVDTSSDPGKGIVGATMQFHGTADRFGVGADTQVVATLYSTATSATPNPAVTVHQVGASGGSASAFTYDLAQSVVLTRQGNPAWVNQNRDGQDGPSRSDDLFYGPMTGDVQPNYVDLSKIAIPQADEQQRLLANVMTDASLDAQPLPRFWYLPHGAKAAIVMTADQHDGGAVPGRFDQEIAASPASCSVADWECVRSTSYLYPDYPSMTDAQAKAYEDQGFEIALHPNTECQSYSRAQYADALATQLAALAETYPSLQPPVTSRNHCISWTDYTTVPEELARQGIHLDTNYYYWPPTWLNDVPGLFTGSGFPQRFATTTGRLVDVYQAATVMTDESGQTYPYNAATLLDRALGSDGFYGTFVANVHSDGSSEGINADIVAAAQARGVPVVSAQQLLTWTDGRNASSFGDLAWGKDDGRLTFTIDVAPGARGLQAMIPQTAGGAFESLTGPDGSVTPTERTVKGVTYEVFAAQAGSWTAGYAVPQPDSSAPTVTGTVPGDGATGVRPDAPVRATFSEAVQTATVSADTFTLAAGGTSVTGTVTHDADGRTATFTPAAALDPETVYTATMTDDVRDLAGNPLAAPVTWTFTTGASQPPQAPGVTDSTEADFGAGTTTGSAVRPDGGGAVSLATATDRLDFDSSTLAPGWAARGTPWSAGGSATVADGALTVDGTAVYGPSARYGAVEARATFGTGTFENIGLTGDTDFNDPWFTFGMSSPADQVYARAFDGVTVGLGAGLLNSPHTYRLEWSPTVVRWYVDGTLVHTEDVAPAGPLMPAVSDYNTGDGPVAVDRLQTERYADDGSFTARVLDAGRSSTWGAVTRDADVPAGTTLEVQVRTGETATPDGAWGDFVTVADGQEPGVAAGRYLQYRLVLGTTDTRVSPLVRSVTISGP